MTVPYCKKIAIAGSTGSVGRQALEVIRKNKNAFSITILSAQNNSKLLLEQAIEFRPKVAVIGNKQHYAKLKEALKGLPVTVLPGNRWLNQLAELAEFDMLLNALVGLAGLEPTLNAIIHQKSIALANKECLVAAGDLLMRSARKANADILPVDSEHSAIFQCLQGEDHKSIEKIFLTASGGPFRGRNLQELQGVTPAEATNHPNWEMGKKISVDSATLMNKGMEAIASQWLFELDPKQIEIVLHPQSIIHSMVQFKDGSMKAQMGLPDMKLPIHYALAYPQRLPSDYPRYDPSQLQTLSFEPLISSEYPCLRIAEDAMHTGGNAPCAMNAANEVAVASFLNNEISFLQIPEVIEASLSGMTVCKHPGLNDIIETDAMARVRANEAIKTIRRLNR